MSTVESGYGARQAFSVQNLSLLPDGRVQYRLNKPWGPRGITHLTMQPVEFLHRLATLIPKPYLNLTRYHGVFAPNARRRNEVCPGPNTSRRRCTHAKPPPREGAPALGPVGPTRSLGAVSPASSSPTAAAGPTYQLRPKPHQRSESAAEAHRPDVADTVPPAARPWTGSLPWAELMKRTFHEDILRCPRCKKDSLSIIAFITDITVVLKILKHLKLPTDAPKLDPARYPEAFELDFDDEAEPAQQFEPTPPVAGATGSTGSRGPPAG
jgi:hypothetical protein